MIKINKIGYWKIAYFLSPIILATVIRISLGQLLYDSTVWEEILLLYLIFVLLLSFPLGFIASYLLPLSVEESSMFANYFPYLSLVIAIIIGYVQWFYLLPKWTKWRQERAE